MGWTTNRKIVVIESDDWGSIRMPSKAVYEELFAQGIQVNSSPYCKYDSLESEDDLSELFEVLRSVKDSKGNSAKITANCIMANPDFKRIKSSGFSKYFYEPVTETFKNYPNHSNSFNLWLKGLADGIFIPQFHGREHVNAPLWLKALGNNDKHVSIGFDNNFFGFDWPGITSSKFGFMAPFDSDYEDTAEYQKEFIEEGLTMFNSFFGFKSTSFIAPCYTWGSLQEGLALKNGVQLMQGIPFQLLPTGVGRAKRKFHFIGQQKKGIVYTTRNCFFEPTLTGRDDAVESCINRIEIAFNSKKPAIIGSHRLNYIGSIDASNSNLNLVLLKKLLSEIKIKWPEVEFLSTPELLKSILDKTAD